MKVDLENYLNSLERKEFLRRENIGNDQIKALLLSASKNIAASEKNISIDEEACYTLAYTAMIKIARAVIFLHGYRPSDGQQHRTTIEAAGKILGSGFEDLIVIFDKMRKKRNQFTYEPMLPLSLTEAKNALKTAGIFHKKVKSFLNKKYPQLELFE